VSPQNCYGITEFGGPLALEAYSLDRISTDVLIPIKGVDFKIKNNDLLIKTNSMMLGYLDNNKKLTKLEGRSGGGYYCTGDIGSEKKFGFSVTGRRKRVIIKGGVNISPLVIEETIMNFYHNSDAAVVFKMDENGDDKIILFISYDEGVINNSELFKLIRLNCGASHLPDKIIKIGQIPLLSNGKVDYQYLGTLMQ
jgi:acyl-coenzyme A synthetase/AMP-(fatty) acid ligase